MKCICLILIVAIGLQTLLAEDEVTEPEPSDNTEPSIISEKVKLTCAPEIGSEFILIVF